MSQIEIEEKNINDIILSNFLTVGPYQGGDVVIEPWQGRKVVNGEEQDLRFPLGTTTDNNRNFWEFQTTDSNTRKSQFVNKRIMTARATVPFDINLIFSVSEIVDVKILGN